MYELEVKKIIKIINKKKVKLVCLQLPDGLKPKVNEIQDLIKKETKAEIIIWAGSCYGSCDIPFEINTLKPDLIIHFGHSKWE